MSPFKRTERAAAKQRARGSHAKPGGPVYPLMRTPVAQLLVNPHAPAAEVPPELAERDYEFPHVPLPDARPLVTPGELRAVLEDDDTQPIEPVALHYGNDFLLPVCEPGIGERVTVTCDENEVTCAVCRNWLEHVQPSALDGLVIDEPHAGRQLAAMWREQLAQDFPPPLAGVVVDEAPRPAEHEGLAPAAAPVIPVPSLPFLNAGAPEDSVNIAEYFAPPTGRHASKRDSGLPARLTAAELMLLGRPIPDDAPAAVRRPAPVAPGPQRRDAAHLFTFAAFDDEFWELVDTEVRQRQAGPGGLRMATDAAMDALDAHLAGVDATHRAQVERGTGVEYAVWLASQLADADRPALPRRTPGAALAAIEASRGELVAS